MSQPQYEEYYENHKETEAVAYPEKNHTQELEDEVARLSKLLATSEQEKQQFQHLRQRYEDEKGFFYQERLKAEQRMEWLNMGQGRALDLVRAYIDAYLRLYGEMPKFVPVPKELFRELHPTERLEFYHMHRQIDQFLWNPEKPFEYERPQVSKVSVRLVEVD